MEKAYPEFRGIFWQSYSISMSSSTFLRFEYFLAKNHYNNNILFRKRDIRGGLRNDGGIRRQP
jgi:hypothetical protein